jgi:hypothetical protein
MPENTFLTKQNRPDHLSIIRPVNLIKLISNLYLHHGFLGLVAGFVAVVFLVVVPMFCETVPGILVAG